MREPRWLKVVRPVVLTLLLLFTLLACASMGQNTEIWLSLNSGLFSFRGNTAEKISQFNLGLYGSGIYTNNPYGAKNGLCYGFSGQIQHLVGMRDSKMIIAINNNPSAPIFEASDMAVVGDLYEIVPRLTAAIAARSA